MNGLSFTIITSFIISVGVQFIRKWNKGDLTLKTASLQFVCSIWATYLLVLIWPLTSYSFDPAIPNMFLSFFSVFIVNEVEKIFMLGFPNWVRGWINIITAKHKDDV